MCEDNCLLVLCSGLCCSSVVFLVLYSFIYLFIFFRLLHFQLGFRQQFSIRSCPAAMDLKKSLVLLSFIFLIDAKIHRLALTVSDLIVWIKNQDILDKIICHLMSSFSALLDLDEVYIEYFSNFFFIFQFSVLFENMYQ